jgi:hypothetical protein
MTAKRSPARSLPPVDGVKFAVLDGCPVRFTDREAWWLVRRQWQPLHPAEAICVANLFCDWAFDRALPPLPVQAFH